MSTEHVVELPDPSYVYASAHCGTEATKTVRFMVTTTDDGITLLHVFVNGLFHMTTTERNWQTIWSGFQHLEVPVTTTHVIRFNDDNGTASIDTVVR